MLPRDHNKDKPITKTTFNMSTDIMDYFKHMSLGHGWIQNCCAEFWTRFHAACREAGIPPVWEPDNLPRVAAVLSKLSFSPVVEVKETVVVKRKLKVKSDVQPD
jgi:hypothetical protein